MNTSREVDFVDESAHVAEDASSENGCKAVGRQKIPSQDSLDRSKRAIGKSETHKFHASGHHDVAKPDMHTKSSLGEQALWGPSELHRAMANRENFYRPSEPLGNMFFSGSKSSAPDLQSELDHYGFQPLENPKEARLFRFFKEKVGSWWDITNSENIWGETVPRLALKSPILLNAIFLVASQHIRRVDPLIKVEPLDYHSRLLSQLIPCLQQRNGINDDCTLAATTLLRAFEDCVAGTKGQSHLSTFGLFTRTGGFLNPSSLVVKACFMAYIRAEVYSALLGQQLPQVNYRAFMFPDLVQPLDDVAWTNRIVWITARVLQWCAMECPAPNEWLELSNLVDEWESSRPNSFSPFFYREEDVLKGRYFPDIWYSSLHHTDGNQHLHMARTALAVQKPTSYQLPTEHLPKSKAKEAIVKGLKIVMAIARCNSHTPAFFVAGNFTDRYATMLEDERDRKETMLFLTEVCQSGWPTLGTKSKLKKNWGWLDEDSPQT